jgi:hypothetical protein
MAKIERVIDGIDFAWPNGSAAFGMGTVLQYIGEPIVNGFLRASVPREAFDLIDEWEKLDRKEKLNAPPTAKLPDGYALPKVDSCWLPMGTPIDDFSLLLRALEHEKAKIYGPIP